MCYSVLCTQQLLTLHSCKDRWSAKPETVNTRLTHNSEWLAGLTDQVLANHRIRLAGSALLFEGLDIGGATPSLSANAEELPSAGSGKGGSNVIGVAGNDSNAEQGTQARSDTYL